MRRIIVYQYEHDSRLSYSARRRAHGKDALGDIDHRAGLFGDWFCVLDYHGADYAGAERLSV